jgi:uncharacterized protein (TIGR00255 family)
MLRSMTGYGRGEASINEVTVLVELRSVNNRFRDLQVRCPREYMPLEPRITQVLKEPFHRGRIDAFIRRSVTHGAQVVQVDPDLAGQYLQAVGSLQRQLPALAQQAVSLDFVIGQPGVLVVVEAEVDVRREWQVVETALNAAIEDMLHMREREGHALAADLERHLTELRGLTSQIEDACDGINERLQARLEGRLARLLGDRIDPSRLAQEAALLADKADVSEEIARLRSHCDQFADALASNAAEPVGRRLEFLIQELHREINTIGSKSAEHPVSQRVVDMKSVLERMREQSANVE